MAPFRTETMPQVFNNEKGNPVTNLPYDLFGALQVKNKRGKVIDPWKARPSGQLVTREFNDLLSLAVQQANSGKMSPEIMAKYGITPSGANFVGSNAGFYQQQAYDNRPQGQQQGLMAYAPPMLPYGPYTPYGGSYGQQSYGGQQGLSAYAPMPYMPYTPTFGSTFQNMGANPYMR